MALVFKKKRLIPKEDIEWLTEPQKAEYRKTLNFFSALLNKMENAETLSDVEIGFLTKFTGSGNAETWFNACVEAYEKSAAAYVEKLRRMGQHQLAAYHEAMNPEQPPAHHHLWLCNELEKLESGEYKTMLISLPPGAAKPVWDNHNVSMGDGTYKKLRDVVAGDYVIGKSGKPCLVTAVHDQGVLPTIKITTDMGQTLFAEASHPILTARGWVNAGDLEVCDILAKMANAQTSVQVNDEQTLARAALAGYFCGDGCVREHARQSGRTFIQANVTCGDPLIADHVVKTAERAGFAATIRHYPSRPNYVVVRVTDGVRPWLYEIGLAGHGSLTKFVPDFVFAGGVETIKAFLGAYMACDGSIYGKKGRYDSFTLNMDSVTVSETLGFDIQRAWLRLGVQTRCYHGRVNYTRRDGTKTETWRVKTHTAHDSWLAIRLLKDYWVGEKYARAANFKLAAQRIDQTYLPDAVKTIESGGELPCRCLTVEGDESFVVENIVVHNSTYGSRSFIQWVMGRNPDWPILQAGHSEKFSMNEFSKPNRDTVDTENYRAIFPDIFLSQNDQGADYWKLENFKGKYYSKGVGGGLSGIRAMLTNIDDPIKSASDAASATVRESQWRWVTADVMSRRLPSARLCTIMTRWNSHDIAGEMQSIHEKDPEALMGPVKIINIPAQAGEDDPLGRPVGGWLWEEFYGAKHYETLRLTMPPSLWSALYMGVPVDKFGDYIAEDKFMRYESYPTEPGKIAKTVISVDTAQKAGQRSNPTAITVWRQGIDKIHYCLHAVKVRSKMDDVTRLLTRLAQNYSADYILIEDAGFGSQILQNYNGKLSAPIVQYSPHSKGSKDFAFENAVTYITSGVVQFPTQAPWLTDFINELVAFPGGAEDDYVDSFSQYVNHTFKRFQGGTKRLTIAG